MSRILLRARTRWQRLRFQIKAARRKRPDHFATYLPYVEGKHGLEIGGPSEIFRPDGFLPVYLEIGSLDNCDFSKSTVWASHSEKFEFLPGKPSGKTYLHEGSNLTTVADSSYDVVLSSHNLEHYANPVKALREWQRVLKPNGALVLVLPFYRATFDHRRKPTSVDHMLADFENGTAEDDLTHLEEIMKFHDLEQDPGGCTPEQFRARSLDNLNNRCLHHHVFNEANSKELLARVGFTVLTVDFSPPFHMCILARMS